MRCSPCHSLALCVQDGARLNVRIRVVSPEEVQAALAALRERHGATGYDGRGPPTETSVGLREKRFVTLPEDLLELLVTLQPQKLSFFACERLVALPEGRLPSLCRPLPLWCPTAPGLLLPLPLPPPILLLLTTHYPKDSESCAASWSSTSGAARSCWPSQKAPLLVSSLSLPPWPFWHELTGELDPPFC